MRELRIPTRKTNPIHNDVPENTTFFWLDQPSGEEKTTGTLINKMDEVAINAKTANWKAIVIFLILHTNKSPILIFLGVQNSKKTHHILVDSTPNLVILNYYHFLLPLFEIRTGGFESFFPSLTKWNAQRKYCIFI